MCQFGMGFRTKPPQVVIILKSVSGQLRNDVLTFQKDTLPDFDYLWINKPGNKRINAMLKVVNGFVLGKLKINAYIPFSGMKKALNRQNPIAKSLIFNTNIVSIKKRFSSVCCSLYFNDLELGLWHHFSFKQDSKFC